MPGTEDRVRDIATAAILAALDVTVTQPGDALPGDDEPGLLRGVACVLAFFGANLSRSYAALHERDDGEEITTADIARFIDRAVHETELLAYEIPNSPDEWTIGS